ncbi:sodium-dependent phosphate transporter 1-B-like isoform X2 [Tachypleus tridentatus]
MYEGAERELLLGNLAALIGSASWNILATFLRLPISGTHSIVGAVVGFSLVARGSSGIQWNKLGFIVASWFISPVLSGTVSVLIFIIIRHLILKKENQLEVGLTFLPFIYAFTVFVNVFSVVHDGPSVLKLDKIYWWGALITGLSISVITGIVVWCFVVPRLRKTILDSLETNTSSISLKVIRETGLQISEDSQSIMNGSSVMMNHPSSQNLIQEEEKDKNNDLKHADGVNGIAEIMNKKDCHSLSYQYQTADEQYINGTEEQEMKSNNSVESVEDDKPETRRLFSFLQILTAVFGAFAHGGNDVSNAIGPLVAVWLIFLAGDVQQKEQTPIYLLVYGGVGISVGLWIWGQRVMKTVGEDLVKITPSSGFTIEIGAATTVLLASKTGFPISTTHCKVGSVVCVGWARMRKGVDWKLFRTIILAWVLTLPVTAGLSAMCMAIFYGLKIM